jgi:hypothetical protein
VNIISTKRPLGPLFLRHLVLYDLSLLYLYSIITKVLRRLFSYRYIHLTLRGQPLVLVAHYLVTGTLPITVVERGQSLVLFAHYEYDILIRTTKTRRERKYDDANGSFVPRYDGLYFCSISALSPVYGTVLSYSTAPVRYGRPKLATSNVVLLPVQQLYVMLLDCSCWDIRSISLGGSTSTHLYSIETVLMRQVADKQPSRVVVGPQDKSQEDTIK